jgi:metallo-beta-lactamase family protein
MKVTVLGAAREVTGSCYFVEAGGCRFLVDCGMFQGGREGQARNRRPFAFDPRALDFVILTHAHIDHSGLLPRLWLEGFAGPVYVTEATADLLAIMLPDSGHLQEMEAERAAFNQRRGRNNHGRNRSHSNHNHGNHEEPFVPLYSVEDARETLKLLRPLGYDAMRSPHAAVQFRFREAGHILGSAIVEIWVTQGGERRKLVFTGDLGQPGRPILRDPALIEHADALFIESTYGDRAHKDLDSTLREFEQAVNHTLHEMRGNVIIPSFAVGRTQELIYYFHDLARQGRFRDLTVYVDSPMATAATAVTWNHMELFDKEARRLTEWMRHNGRRIRVHFVETMEESRALNAIESGLIVISASGMCDGGRVKYHLKYNLPRAGSSVLITGFQAQGTLGRRLVDGAEGVRIFGEEVPVRARIHTLGGFSAHADQAALLAWLRGFRQPPRQTFVVHGEENAALTFAGRVRQDLGWNEVNVPSPGEAIGL